MAGPALALPRLCGTAHRSCRAQGIVEGPEKKVNWSGKSDGRKKSQLEW